MANGRVTVGVLTEDYHELARVAKETGHAISALVDRAVENFLEDEAPIWTRAAKEAREGRRRKKNDKSS